MGTHWGRNTALGGIRWLRAAPPDTTTIRVTAGERPFGPGNGWRPQQDSNLRSRLRRALLGGLVTWGSGPAARVRGCTRGAGT